MTDSLARNLAASAIKTTRQTPRGYIRNDTAANMGLYRRRVQALLNGDQTLVRINMFGDSYTLGAGGTYYRNSIGAWLAKKFRADGFTVSDNKFGVYSTAAATATYDSRFSFSGTWAGWQDLPGGKSFRCTSASGAVTYSPGVSFDTMVVKWFRDTAGNGGGGNMIITVDGGGTSFSTPTSGGSVTSQTISQSGVASIQDLVITVAAGVHTVTVTNDVTGNIEIYGFEYYTAATPTILIRTMGASGYDTTNFVANSTPTRMYDAPLTADLSIFCLGGNDNHNSIALSTMTTNLGTLKTSLTALGTASILAWTWPPGDVATYPQVTQKSYIDAFIAAMGSNVQIYDLYQRYVDMGGQELLSITTGGLYKDTIHPGALGNMDIASSLYAAFMPQGV